ncbi:MAG TPA: autoinducer binding domain-containing protein [Burkholderiaceae bacterium]|nr:autoinducer binding domain-containing protein [Burkholderiaceae bacterium]
MLQGGFTEVLGSRNRDELRGKIVSFTKRLGFETVSATVVIDHMLAESEFLTVDNTPPGFLDAFQNREYWRLDPVMQHCKRNSMPIIWSQETYVANGQGEKWEEQARFGYRNGIALALHLPEGRHFFLGVDRDQPVAVDAGELTRLVAELQLFAVHAQEAALRILTPASPDPDVPTLTPRELESLRWTMDGKTAWEVGNVLGITERTAALHINNATHKLGCANKHQAVLKAIRLGMIR